MTIWRKVLDGALEALEFGPPAPRTAHRGAHKPRAGGIVRQPVGDLVELLSQPVSECPHCGKPIPRAATRRRRLVQVTAGGKVLSTEIEP